MAAPLLVHLPTKLARKKMGNDPNAWGSRAQDGVSDSVLQLSPFLAPLTTGERKVDGRDLASFSPTFPVFLSHAVPFK